jgi:hypothetical protein
VTVVARRSWAVTALLAAVWLAAGPRTPDLAAQVHRVAAFRANGFAIWDNTWYAGHNVLGYSLVFPAVGAALGTRLAGAVAAVASAALFETLVGRRSAAARWWFAAGCAADLLIGRLTYALGVAIGLGAVTALSRRRPQLATALAALCAATSPVAGLFLVLAGVASAIAKRRRAWLAVAAAAAAVVLALGMAFPDGGSQPFSPAAFLVTVAICAAAALVAGCDPVVRWMLALYLLAVVLSFAVPSPMGANVTRLGTAFLGPALLVAGAGGRTARRAGLVLVLCAVALWQWVDPFTQAARGWSDPSSARAYYEPLIAHLHRAGGRTFRVEVPFTRGHWESVYLARDLVLARGWERQLDRRLNPVFYGQRLSAVAYHRWLRANAVRYVALPDVPMDPAGRREAELVRRAPPFLEPVWADAHWRLFRVRDPLPLASRGAMARLSDAGVRLHVQRPGRVLLRVHWTPYWRVSRGASCLAERRGWTELVARRPATVVLSARFSLGGVLERLPPCPPRAAGG